MGYIASIVSTEFLEGLNAKPLDEQIELCTRFSKICTNRQHTLRRQQEREPGRINSTLNVDMLGIALERASWEKRLNALLTAQMQATAGQ